MPTSDLITHSSGSRKAAGGPRAAGIMGKAVKKKDRSRTQPHPHPRVCATTKERQQILDLLRKHHPTPMSPKDVADLLGKKQGTVKMTLLRLKERGLVDQPSYGKYVVVSDSSDSSDAWDSSHVVTEKAPESTPALWPRAIAELFYVKKRQDEIGSMQAVCNKLNLPVDKVDDIFIGYCKETVAAPVELVGLHHHLISRFFQENTTKKGGGKPPDKQEFRQAYYAEMCTREAQRFKAEFLHEVRGEVVTAAGKISGTRQAQ